MKHATKNTKYKVRTKRRRRMFHVSCFMFHEEGFGLLEAMVSMFIMITAITGAMYLVSGGIINIGVSEDRLIAINLAQEGLEVVHNIRDTNWLAGRGWNRWRNGSPGDDTLPPSASGATSCATCYVLWNSQSLTTNSTIRDLKWSTTNLRYDNTGATGETFARAIKITNDPDASVPVGSSVKIESVVGWGQGNNCTVAAGVTKRYCVTLEERLYNWLQ